MAKGRKPNDPQQISKDYLIKPIDRMKKELADRLKIGDDLLTRSLTNQNELSLLKNDFYSWSNYNAELLKQSFNNANNSFYKEYTYVGIMIGSIGPSTFREAVDEIMGDVESKYNRLKRIYEKIELVPVSPELELMEAEELNDTRSLHQLENLLNRFHKVAQTIRQRYDNRPSIVIKDEYDVQDLLRGLLKIYFDDIREEDYVSSNAGSNSRVDFVLKEEQIVIETKMTNEKLTDKEIGNQLLVDIGRYRNHPDCKTLVCFIYDKGDHIINKAGLIRDLERMATDDVKIRVFINP
jgi:REase_DpnII-MboI